MLVYYLLAFTLSLNLKLYTENVTGEKEEEVGECMADVAKLPELFHGG